MVVTGTPFRKELKDVGYSAAELEHNGFTLEGMVGELGVFCAWLR